MTGSEGSVVSRGLVGKVTNGANDISISIEDEHSLRFLSQAGFSAGTASGPLFSITENNANQLIATYFDGQSSNSFVLNKLNGLAIWSKIRPTFPGYGSPAGSQTYLACK